MRIRKPYLYLLGFCLLALSFNGCATAPVRGALPTYNINGVTYLPLLSLCESKGVAWDYDTYTRTVNLTKGTHKVNLMVGQTLILVDGRPENLTHPVDIYKGTIVVPSKFQEQFFDALTREPVLHTRLVTPFSKIRRIVIDAGHGGNDPGAMGRSGLREKDVNLDIAKRVAKLMKEEGMEVVMTRSTDRFIPLPQRVEIANDTKADLFVSIHTNANRVKSMSGFEVYYVSPYISDSKRALSAAINGKLKFDSSCFDNPTTNLKAVLWDMIYTSGRAESIELSRKICRVIGHDLDCKVLGVKSANYFVLKGARMPAVLVEIGFISNSTEERLLKNNYYRQQIADSIGRGITDYIKDYSLLE